MKLIRQFAVTIRKDLEHMSREHAAGLRCAVNVAKGTAQEFNNRAEAEHAWKACLPVLFELCPDAIAISESLRGPILDVNENWENLFGYAREEVIGNTALKLNLYADVRKLAKAIEKSSEGNAIRSLEVEIQDKEGGVRTAILSGGKIGNGSKKYFITILRNITEQRKIENEARNQGEQLRYLTRVITLGKLSGALAHELNQPLAAILANAQAGRRFMNRQHIDLNEIRDIFDDIVEENKRAGEVIHRLKNLFMKGESKMRPLNISKLVQDSLKLTHGNLIELKVTVDLQLNSQLDAVIGDQVQLQQVLLNLIINACEAMKSQSPESRTLTLMTDSDKEGNVLIIVSDTGMGISSDVLGNIFDSFFSTKDQGMGLGLSISRTIIEEHGGCIDAINNQGPGVTFRITLPAYPLEPDDGY